MSLFKTLMSKIFSHATAASASTAQSPGAGGGGQAPAGSPPTAQAGGSAGSATSPAAGAGSPAAAPAQQVDVGATLDALAKSNPEKLDWKRSIVDLMKLVGMDSSLSARKELAKDLNYTGDTSDSAKMNMWLHKEVLKKLSENGGKVPADLLNK